MSTAMVSHVNDYASDMLKQANQKFPLERKLSSPIGGLQSLRRLCSAGPQFLVNSSSPSQKVLLSQTNSNQMPREHRKLDRSISEPIDKSSQIKVPQANSTRYKTELCRPFEESGSCKYGEKCQFAHGPAELRMLARHPKYKTELCRTFHSTGLCPYGPRCHFIHNDEGRNQTLTNQVTSSMQSLSMAELPSMRPKALSIGLGSTGDLSPTSSSGSPTSSLSGFFLDDNCRGMHSPSSPPVYDFSKQLSPSNSPHFPELGLLMDTYSPGLLPASLDSPTSQGEDPFPMEADVLSGFPTTMQQKCSPNMDNRRIVRLPIFNLLAQ